MNETPVKSNWFYCLIGIGMALLTRLRFGVRVFGTERFEFERGTILAVSHRSDWDVPLICGTLIMRRRLWWPGKIIAALAARDDMFEPGFLAGNAKQAPRWLRRLLWPLNIGPIMERWLHCQPVRGDRLRLIQALRIMPDQTFLAAIPERLLGGFVLRAERLGRPAPRLVRDVLNTDYADLLWEFVEKDEFPQPELRELWQARRFSGLRDLKCIAQLVKAGSCLIYFPEGRPSPDGGIGPIKGGLDFLVRRGQPGKLQMVAIAYDPLVSRRPRAYVSIGTALPPIHADIDERVLEMLRYLTPLTVGQLAARFVVDGGRRFDDLLDEADRRLRQAETLGRPYEPGLRGPGGKKLLRKALNTAQKLGPEHPIVQRLAREYQEVSYARERVLGWA